MSNKPILLFVVLSIFAGCGAPEPTATNRANATANGNGDGDEVGVYPTEVWTGFDGEHDFVVPVSSIGGKASWKAADEDMVSLEASAKGVKVTAKHAGTTTLTAKIGTKSFKVKVNIREFSAGAWAKGEKVYKTSVNCGSCHVKASGPDHSPTEIGKHEDAHLEKRILTGESLHGEEPTPNHAFKAKLADGELEGVVAYLRALEPGGWPKEVHDHEHEHEDEDEGHEEE